MTPVATDDDPSAEWLEDADTFVTGAIPELAEDLEETTPRRALCPDCLAPTMPGGVMPATPAEWAQRTTSEACLRGERWAFCARQGKLSLWFPKTG